MNIVTSQERIWQTTLLIPEGKVVSYGQIADLAGLPGRARMVGKAMRAAPKSMNLPWHRVLRSDGKIAFDKGSDSAKLQTGLLQEEGVVVNNNRVSLAQFQWQPDLNDMLFQLKF